MDCKYIQRNDIHEKHLLNRLPESEKDVYEKHIAGCNSCKQELEKQKRLIVGIRAVGEQEMKDEIRMQVEEARAQQKPVDQRFIKSHWQMILKVAAVLFIIALVPSAIYYFQTDTGELLSGLPKAALETEQDMYYATEESLQQEKGKFTEAKSKPSEKKRTMPALEQAATPEGGSAPRGTPEQPASRMAMGEADSAIKGRGIGSEEMVALEEAEDSIGEIVGPQTVSAQIDSLQAEIDKEELEQVLANGITFQFAQAKEGDTGRFDTEEITTLQKYNAPAAQKLTPSYRMKEKEGVGRGYAPKSTAIFRAQDKQITIYFNTSQRELALDKKSNLPESFDVLILNRDSLDWEMIWQVNNEFLKYDPSQMEIVTNDQTMYLTIPDDYVYLVDLKSDSTKAILVKK